MTFKTQALRIGLIGLFTAAAGLAPVQAQTAGGQSSGAAGSEKAADAAASRGKSTAPFSTGPTGASDDGASRSTAPGARDAELINKKPQDRKHAKPAPKGQGASAPTAK